MPPDMQRVVDEDNQKLQDEIREYDDKQQRSRLVPSPFEDASHLGPRPDVTGEERQSVESGLQGLGFPRVLDVRTDFSVLSVCSILLFSCCLSCYRSLRKL